MKRVVLALAAAMTFGAPLTLHSQGSGAIASRDSTRRVLMVGAHPDDEDTQLIAWLQRGGYADAAYLSITRGDGGQNLIGNELGEPLGVIRTQELLSARRVDGAHQYFTRAYDFGFSKSAEETFTHWPKDSLLNDVVRVVRAFRPHVIIAIFSGTPRDGHGQHQVSAILAKEAFEVSGDTGRFPEATFGAAWTVSKFYRDRWFEVGSPTLKINVGEYNPLLGKSYAEIAGESRSQHRSQGFGALQPKGVVFAHVKREGSRVNESTPADQEKSIFDGIEVKPALRSAEQEELARDVALEAIADRRYVAVGDSARVTATVYNRSRRQVVLSNGTSADVTLAPDSAYRWVFYARGDEVTQPWWLVSPRNGAMFTPPIDAIPEDERQKQRWAKVMVRSAGSSRGVAIRSPIVFRYVDLVRGEIQLPLAVAPAISIALDNVTELARANTPLERFYNVTLRSARTRRVTATVSMVLPRGLVADSASRTVMLDSAATRTVTFRVKGKLAAGVHELTARASAEGITHRTGYVPVEYDHITPDRIYRPAEVSIHAVDVQVPAGLRVAYVRGVGDNVEPALEQLGIPVTMIEPRSIPTVDLSKFTTVVVGPRAYQASRDLVDNNPYLLNFAQSGGTLVVQYGQYEMMRPGMMPYSISIARPHDRVTQENAPVSIIDASLSVLRTPNTITNADFDGWIQERSLYMPRTFDERYRPVLALNDPGEQANRGAIMIAPYGRGLYVYTTLAFFRQLPAGVGGATRLFVNLLSTKNSQGAARAVSGQ
jgi:LmbE family N-acetylglucosaminyl deacetylase